MVEGRQGETVTVLELCLFVLAFSLAWVLTSHIISCVSALIRTLVFSYSDEGGNRSKRVVAVSV